MICDTVFRMDGGERKDLSGIGVFPWSVAANTDSDITIISKSSLKSRKDASNLDYDRLMSHEVGHALGLFHTFRGGCSALNDEVDDTPKTSLSNRTCDNNDNGCNDNKRMAQNPMDYSLGCSAHAFTEGQVDRIESFGSAERASLWGITCKYNINIQTSSVKYADTDDHLEFCNEAGCAVLDYKSHNDFERGDKKSYSFNMERKTDKFFICSTGSDAWRGKVNYVKIGDTTYVNGDNDDAVYNTYSTQSSDKVGDEAAFRCHEFAFINYKVKHQGGRTGSTVINVRTESVSYSGTDDKLFYCNNGGCKRMNTSNHNDFEKGKLRAILLNWYP